MDDLDTDRAIDALYCIRPDLPHDEWVKIAMAAQSAGIDFDTFNNWSAPAANYNDADCRNMWKSIKPGKGIGAGTLFKIAAANGWSQTKGSHLRRVSASRIETPTKPCVGVAVDKVWERCQPASNEQPYIVKKRAEGVPLDGLRVLPSGDILCIQSESMGGALVVPVIRPDGTISSLQFIAPPDVAERLKAKGKPDKLNLPGHPMEGWFTVGVTVRGGFIYIVEGVGQAWACWQATKCAAVVCFGSGRVRAVAAELRRRDPTAQLVVVPDVGKEKQAAEIAAEVQGLLVTMPEGWEQNNDVNDLLQLEGLDALKLLLKGATKPPKPEEMIHPLAKFVDIDGTAKPPCWVIQGFIGHGVVVISGAAGVGKTTALLPLAMTAAGLHGDDALIPRQWRNVVYVTEDVEQARRILAGIVGYSNLGINLASVRERLHIVEAVRLDPAFVVTVGATYREQFTRIVEGVEVLPLVVLDTKSAVLKMDSENDNSEASAIMAELKQGFCGLPVWLIGHVAKASLSRSDVSGLTNRGASAVEGDANQTMYLLRENGSCFLVQGKVRFEPNWSELEIVSHTAQTLASDEFGNTETVTMRWGIAVPAQQTRKEAATQAAETAKQKAAAELRQDVRDAVETAWLLGNALNRVGVQSKLNRKAQTVSRTIENLLSERWLHEVEVPSTVRIVNSKSKFLVNLTTVEHETVLSGGGLPAAKLVIPASWQKPAISLVPVSPNP